MNDMSIARGWTVYSADKKRVGDVTEVHPHYILVSRGVLLVKDMYLPLGAVERAEGTAVYLSVTYAVLRRMDLSHAPPPPDEAPQFSALDQPVAPPDDISAYPSEATMTPTEPLAFPSPWSRDDSEDDSPSYTRPSPNGLVEVDHLINIAYADLGYGMPIMLLQGWPFDSSIWEPLAYKLAVENRTITYDMRGTGESDKPWDYYSVAALANDVQRLAVEQLLHMTTIVAWSTAAPVALQYAAEHKRRVSRLVLISPVILSWLAADDAAAWLGHPPVLDVAAQDSWEAALIEDRPAFFATLIEQLAGPSPSASRREWIFQRLMQGAPWAQIKTFAALRAWDPAQVLPALGVPVTIIQGGQDTIAPPAMASRLASMLPGAQILTFDQCGHAPFLDQPARVIQTIEDLIRPVYEPNNANQDIIEYASTGDAAAQVGVPSDTDPEPAVVPDVADPG